MQNPDNLKVMAAARGLARAVYQGTAEFPAVERFGLSIQMRRSAISIGSNIAEGCGRSGDRELVQFLHIALGSATELEFQTRVGADMGLLSPASADPLLTRISEVKRMLARLIKGIRAGKSATGRGET